MDYHDYIDVNVINEAGKKDVVKSFSKTTFRVNNLVPAKWWAKAKVDDGIYEDYGGIMWTSEGQTSGSEETRNGRPSFMANIDGLLAMVNGGNKLASQEFEKKDLLDLVDKFAELIQEASDSEPADNVDKNSSIQSGLLDQLDAILNKFEEKPPVPKPQVKPVPVKDTKYAPPKNVIYDPNTGEVMQYETSKTETIPSNKSDKPDTIRTTYYQKPRN